MRRHIYLMMTALVITFLLSACGGDETNSVDNDQQSADEQINVVTSFTIIEDMVEQIGGDYVNVYNLVPTGTDPHEYEPLPEDIMEATDADVLFLNGMNLEGGQEGWFYKMIDSVDQDLDNVYELNEGVEPKYLTDEDGEEEEINPHSFLDPHVGIVMAENIRDALMEIDADHAEDYKANAEEYLDRLQEIDAEYEEKIAAIPEDQRILVTSERAFQYMTDRYGLDEAYVWEIDTEELGTPEQIKTLVETLKDKQPPVLFLESNVDERPLETVSEESGIPIYEQEIYSDEIGEKGAEVDTYVKLLTHNIEIIHDGLKDES
ncbi:MAG TPA: zinc ABC transporter substrate-binding protein [Bacillota bacterium]|nr:zinc ABC transporter substrate-binding protein [Bacillota bacterium]